MNNRALNLHFYRNIGYLRRAAGLTQKKMAGIVGISVGTLRRMESGSSLPRANCAMLCRVCDYFGISADAMLRCDLESLDGGE